MLHCGIAAFEITTKDCTYFAYTEKEKSEVLEKIGKTKYTLQRSKGLGENEPEMMWMTTMNPETRRLIRVNAEEAKQTAEMFDLMLGTICRKKGLYCGIRRKLSRTRRYFVRYDYGKKEKRTVHDAPHVCQGGN